MPAKLYRNQSFAKKLSIMHRAEGFGAAARWALGHAIYKIGLKDGPTKRRLKLAKRIEAIFGAEVAYGPFKGLKFPSGNWWGTGDRAGMILGLYEQELLRSLTDIPGRYKAFIDLGAADGYYGVGVLVGGLFERAWCYEQSEKGRESIRRNSLLNKVDDRVTIMGLAEENFYKDIPADIRTKSVLFIDIEGGEFSLLTKDVLAGFKDSIIFIELHDWFFDDGAEKLAALKKRASDLFRITEIRMGARDLSKFAELEQFSDDDRWLLCSEGRAQAMTWLKLDPLDS